MSDTATQTRALCTIAREIRRTWPQPNYAAVPYLNAMMSMNAINEDFYADTGRSVVLYFLSNAATWRGPDAKRIKAELKAMLKADGYKF